MKRCPKCGETKPLNQFYASSRNRDGHQSRCKACNQAMGQEWRLANPGYGAEKKREWIKAHPETAAESQRRTRLAGIYGITPESYDEIMVVQGGVCFICGRPPRTKRLAVDHDHAKGGRVRGLLCSTCNREIIGSRRNPAIFDRAADYLRNPPADTVLGPEHTVPARKKRRKKAA